MDTFWAKRVASDYSNFEEFSVEQIVNYATYLFNFFITKTISVYKIGSENRS